MDYLISRFSDYSLSTRGLTLQNLWERTREHFHHLAGSDTLVVVLPGWSQAKPIMPSFVGGYLKARNVSTLLYIFPQEILSSDAKLTRECFLEIDRGVRQKISELKKEYEFTKVVLVGISLGEVIGSLIYDNNPDITTTVFVVGGNNLARNVWKGCRTQHFRKDFEKQGITLDDLDVLWRDIAPETKTPFPTTRVVLHFGRTDRLVPYEEASTLAGTLQSRGIQVGRFDHYCGHYLLILYFLLFPQRFLKKALH